MDTAFAHLTGRDRDVLLERAERKVFARDDTIVEEGSSRRAVFLIHRGGARAERAQFGRGVAIARLGPGDSFGELSLLAGDPAHASLIADDDQVEVDVLDGAKLDSLLEANPSLGSRLYRSLAEALGQRLRDLASVLPIVLLDQIPQAARSSLSRVGQDGAHEIPAELTAAVDQAKTEFVRTEIAFKAHKIDDAQAQAAVSSTCDVLGRALQAHVRGGPERERRLGAYVFRESFPYLMRSASIDRWFSKPRGYAGDFFTIELIYRNEPDGEGPLGRFVDRWALDIAPARAVRNRRRLLGDAIRDVARESDSEQTLITSLASGPAREIFDFLGEPDAPDVRVTCIDIDPEALAYAAEIARTLGVADRITFAQDNVIHLSRGRGKTMLAPQDVIYSVGLIDYFEDRHVVRMLDWIHDQLVPGGTVLLGNFRDHPARVFMDHCLEWKLIYRSAEDLRALFGKSHFGDAPVEVLSEEEGINLFARCVKESELSEPFRQTGTFAVFTA